MGLTTCLSALVQICHTQLDFRHKCNADQTAEQAAEANQQQACADLLRQASAFRTITPPPVRTPAAAQAAMQAALLSPDPHSLFPLPYQRLPLRPEQQQQAGALPGLFPLLANMQGQTSAMLHLTAQPSHMYGAWFSHPPPPLSGPAPVRAPPPTDPNQRASMESASSNTRPSLDDASMLSRLYPSSSLESSFSHARMSMDDHQNRMSTGSRPSSVSASTTAT